jgi:asparagine synthase (glutamine-hydrolysing)
VPYVAFWGPSLPEGEREAYRHQLKRAFDKVVHPSFTFSKELYSGECFALVRSRVSGATAAEISGSTRGGYPSNRVFLVGDVRLDNRDELAQQLKLDVPGKSLSDLEIVRYAFEKWSLSFAEHLYGDFSVTIFDSANRQIIVARDPFGVKPAFYRCDGRGNIAIGTFVDVLVGFSGQKAKVNPLAVSEFLHGVPIGYGYTFFSEIRSLVPGHTLIFNPQSGPNERRYWNPVPRVYPGRSRTEHLEAFADDLKSSVCNRIRGANRVAVRLSGGLDSSSIALLCNDIRAEGSATSFVGISAVFPGLPDCDERIYSESVASRLGFPVNFVDGTMMEYPDFDSPLLANPGGRSVNIGGAEEGKFLEAFSGEVLLCGARGDAIVQDQAILKDLVRDDSLFSAVLMVLTGAGLQLRKRRFRVLLKACFNRVMGLDNFPAPGFPPYKVPAWLGSACQSLAAEPSPPTRRFADSLTAHSILSDLSPSVIGRAIDGSVRWALDLGVEMRFPFLDRRLLEGVLGIPLSLRIPWRRGRALQREGLARLLPDLVRRRPSKTRFGGQRLMHFERSKSKFAALFEGGWESSDFVDPRGLSQELLRHWETTPGSWDTTRCVQMYRAGCLEAWLRAVRRYNPSL